MSRGRSRRLAVLAAAAALLAAGAWVLAIFVVRRPSSPSAPPRAPAAHTIAPPAEPDDRATVRGTVREDGGAPIGGAQVTLRNTGAEVTAIAARDGTFTLEVQPGRYQVLVAAREHVMAVPAIPARLPGAPVAELAGAPDAVAVPVLDVPGDLDELELPLVRAGTIVGRMLDDEGRPLAGVVVRASGLLRPVLGTDVAISDSTGHATLQVPPGEYTIEATHEDYAGVSYQRSIAVTPGARLDVSGFMSRGCVLAGVVIDPRGGPAPDGAIERVPASGGEFVPAGRIQPDGSFRWVTTLGGDVMLRAWPWRSPPSTPRALPCRHGARFTDLVFQLGDAAPDLQGTLVDARGAPVPFAYLDITPLDTDAPGQQERTDAAGRWQIYRLDAGRYMIAAHAAGGIASELVTAPASDVTLELGGTGRLEGTTTGLADGSFLLTELACANVSGTVLAVPPRIVPVRGGRFAIDDVPACRLVGLAKRRHRHERIVTTVPPDGVASVELELGPPQDKRVRGLVRDGEGRPVEGAVVTATAPGGASVVATTGADGRFTLVTVAGANVTAGARGRSAHGRVGLANVGEELVELVLSVE